MHLTPAEYTAALRAAAALHSDDCPCSTCRPHLTDEYRHQTVTRRTDQGRALTAAAALARALPAARNTTRKPPHHP